MDYLGYAISAAGGGGGGGGGGGSSFDPLFIDSDLVPTDTATYDVGRPNKRWRNGEFTTVTSTSVVAPTVTLTTLASNNPSVNVTALNGVTSSKYIVNGGTDQQYLMGNGSLLKYSANSGNSNFYLYNSSQVITAPPPSGFIRYNNTVQDDATEIYISHLTRDNIDIDVFFSQITPVTEVYIQDQNDSVNFIQYNVLATPSIPPNSYVTISVSKRSSGGTGQNQFPNGHNLLISFFTNGIEVDGRLTTLETKTRNQTATTTTTTFTGTGGIVATKHIVPSGLTSQFLKANGDLDSTTYLALTGGTLTGALSGTSFTGSSLFSPSLDTATAGALTIGTVTQTALTLGRVGATTNLRGLSVVTTGNITPATTNVGTIGTSALTYNNGFFTALSTPTIDTATAVAQNIGTVTQTALTLGRVGATTNLRGLSIVTTGNITPATTNVGTIGTSALTYNNVFTNQITTAGTTPRITFGTGTTITGDLVHTTASTGTIGNASFPWNLLWINTIVMNGNLQVNASSVIQGNLVPNTSSSNNLGSNTNRWNVFAQTLTLPNTAGVRYTNFNSTSTNTVANTTTQTSLLGTGTGSLTLADVVGSTRTIKCSGTLISLASSTLNIVFGNTYGYNFTYTMLAVASAAAFEFELTYTIKNATTYIANARFQYGTNTPILTSFQQAIAAPLNATQNLFVTWGTASASNSITANIGTVETLA